MTKPLIMPAFVFQRRHHVELEAGFILAGQLIVNIPKGTEPKKRQMRMIIEIIQQLTARAQSGQMPNDAMIYGWEGSCRPANAVDTKNDEIMKEWAESSLVIAVRVDSRSDTNFLRIDSDIMRQGETSH